jgi:hypothetical protein
MTPKLTKLANRLMRQISEISPGRERIRYTGDLVDQTFRMLQKRVEIYALDEVLIGDTSDETNPPLERATSGNASRIYSRTLPIALANSLPWLAVFAGAVWDILTKPEMRYEHVLASAVLIGSPIRAWIEFTGFWLTNNVKSSTPLATANGPEVRRLASSLSHVTSEDAEGLIS